MPRALGDGSLGQTKAPAKLERPSHKGAQTMKELGALMHIHPDDLLRSHKKQAQEPANGWLPLAGVIYVANFGVDAPASLCDLRLDKSSCGHGPVRRLRQR